jgi:hypothetical protein
MHAGWGGTSEEVGIFEFFVVTVIMKYRIQEF